MAKLVIEIEMDNAAFQDRPTAEVMRILGTVSDRLDRSIEYLDGKPKKIKAYSSSLYDINGNKVGSVKILGQ